MINQDNNPSQSRQTQVVYGDLDVHHDLNVGGILNARVVRGRNAFCGLFLNQEVLERYFPHPLVGQWALVINHDSNENNEPAQDEEEEPTLAIGWVFDCETEGTWHDAQHRGGCDVEAILVEKSQREAADAELAAADTALGGRIDDEAGARQDADTALGGRIDDEAGARQDADTALGGRITTEETARLAGDITQGEYNAEEDSIDLKNADNVLKVRIPATPFTKDGHVDNVEVTGGKLVITFNSDAEKQPIEIPLTTFFDPDNYYTKSQVYTKSEVYNKSETDNAIGSEATAREEADTLLGTRIYNEATARIAGDITQGEYNAERVTIDLKNVQGELVARINAAPFVVDGMVSSVVISSGNLVITFNTDAGKQPISIPLTDIFDPANYYTKEQVDALDYDVITQEEMEAVLGSL